MNWSTFTWDDWQSFTWDDWASFTYLPASSSTAQRLGGTTLLWPAYPGASSYAIYRDSRFRVETSSLSYADDGVAGGLFLYRIDARDDVGTVLARTQTLRVRIGKSLRFTSFS
jgi:hypothetical protein